MLLLRPPLIDPQHRGHGLGVADAAVADHGQDLGQRMDRDLEELARVELGGPLRQLARQKKLDRLVGVADRGMHHADAGPPVGDVAGFLEELALRGLQWRLARLELAGRDLQENAAVRVPELALEEDRAVLEERHDRDRAGMADVLALAERAVRQAHGIAMDLEQVAVEDPAAGDEMLGEVFQRAWIARKQIAISGCGRMPRTSSARPLADSA